MYEMLNPETPVRAMKTVTRDGSVHTFGTKMSDDLACEYLMKSNDPFASSLAQSYNRKGKWSERQIGWAHKVAYRVAGLQLPKAPNGQAPAAPAADSGIPSYVIGARERKAERERVASTLEFGAILDLFRIVGKKLKAPALSFETPEGIIYFKLMTRGFRRGTIRVTKGKCYPSPILLYIDPISSQAEVGSCDWPAGLLSEMRKLLADPVTAAAEYGKASGRCCFCALKLTDDRSLAEGYGPKCAENYELPWGGKRREEPAAPRTAVAEIIATTDVKVEAPKVSEGPTGVLEVDAILASWARLGK